MARALSSRLGWKGEASAFHSTKPGDGVATIQYREKKIIFQALYR
jgi:hypothetical protein